MTLIGLFLSSLYNYLLFHSLAELFSIVIAWSIFIIAYNTRKFSDNSFFLFLGISSFFIGNIDLIHTLAYTGMGIFRGYGSNLPTSLWIFARYFQAITLLISLVMFNKKINIKFTFFIFNAITILFLGLIFGGFFPICYIEGLGLPPYEIGGRLTLFKIISEYIIIFIVTFTTILLYKKKNEFDKSMLRYLIFALIFTNISELSFTFYIGIYDFSNLIGHYFKILSFYCIYKALIEKNLFEPYSTLFRNLKKSEENLIQEKNNLIILNQQIETIIETVPNGILFLEEDGQISMINNTFKNFYYQIYQEKISINKNFFNLTGNLLLETVKEFISLKKEDRKIIEIEKDKFLEVSFSSVNLGGKSSHGFLIVVHDVTKLVQLIQWREKLISLASHELRTPLTAIDMSIKNLGEYWDKLTKNQRDSIIKIISKNSLLLIQLVEDLLTSSSIDAGNIILKKTKFNFNKIMQDILFQMEPYIIEKEIKIEKDLNPDIQIFGDPKKISQIFRILIDNAIKYSHKKSIIKISMINHYQGELNIKGIDGILIQISDSGIGIRKNDIPKIFKKFFRTGDAKDMKGTGLGLNIAQELAHLHEGEIFVKSEYGKGSMFSVFLPRMSN